MEVTSEPVIPLGAGIFSTHGKLKYDELDGEPEPEHLQALNISCLPIELLVRIFKLIPNHCEMHCHRVRGVCRAWDSILDEDFRFRNLPCSSALHDVSYDVLEIIFGFVSPQDKKSLRLVCWEWKEAVDYMTRLEKLKRLHRERRLQGRTSQ